MAPTRRRYLAAAAGAIVLAGCQSGPGDSNGEADGGGSPTEASTTDTPTPADGDSGAAVRVRDHPDFGEILVDAEGMTLYMFDSDTRGSGESTCSDGCLENWPALLVDGDATAGDGVTASLSTFQRGDGDTQVAANGWPLYYYVGDGSAGDVTGQAVNDVWWVLDPTGEPIRSTPTATSEPAGGGAGY